jgi:hypothetical protein
VQRRAERDVYVTTFSRGEIPMSTRCEGKELASASTMESAEVEARKRAAPRTAELEYSTDCGQLLGVPYLEPIWAAVGGAAPSRSVAQR